MFTFSNFMGIGEQDYSVQLRCFSAPFFPKYDKRKINELNYGGKILLPNSTLDNLVRRHIQWPMLFKISPLNPDNQKCTHAGVLEFLAEEGKCYFPSWIMDQLGLTEGDHVNIEYKSLPKATYARFKPHSTDFLHVTNPRAMLEVELRKFACLTKHDIIAVQYNDQVFEFKVMDVKPANAVTIIECDVNIEFDAPDGYTEPTHNLADHKVDSIPAQQPSSVEETINFPFSGKGTRLDGKDISKSTTVANACRQATTSRQADISVDENYEPGTLKFIRYEYKSKATLERLEREKACSNNKVKIFDGVGQTIKPKR